MTAPRCFWCGSRPGPEDDHLFGRDSAGRYVVPAVIVPSCRACNVAGWHDWRALGLDTIGAGAVAFVVVVLRRLAYAFRRLGDAGRPVVELPAGVCTQVGAALAWIADQVDEEARR
jgi:hypothetical protein